MGSVETAIGMDPMSLLGKLWQWPPCRLPASFFSAPEGFLASRRRVVEELLEEGEMFKACETNGSLLNTYRTEPNVHIGEYDTQVYRHR